MLSKMVKRLPTLGFYAFGLGVLFVTWDFTQEAKAAGYDYSLSEYAASAVERHSDKTAFALAAIHVTQSKVRTGMSWVKESSTQALVLQSDGPAPTGADSGIGASVDTNSERSAFMTSQFAPERSLSPRARPAP